MPEPSLLDYLKALLRGQQPPAIPPLPSGKGRRTRLRPAATSARRPRSKAAAPAFTLAQLPWRSLGAVLLFLAGQALLSLAGSSPATLALAVPLWVLALGLAIWANRHGEWALPALQPAAANKAALSFRRTPLIVAAVLFVLTFLLSGHNRFNLLNVVCWLGALGSLLYAFWQPGPRRPGWRTRWAAFWAQPEFTLRVGRHTLLLLLLGALILAVRLYALRSAPPEMVSDHAEMLLDLLDIRNGQAAIFFERNTGREPLPFYLAAWVGRWFGTGVSFLTLKLTSTLASLAGLVFMYLMGEELGGRRVGVFTLALAGLAYWPNVLAHLGLNFYWYATLTAPTLYFLLRGIRRGQLNDYLLAGVCLGIGLNGYTAFRIVPLVAAAALAIFLLHRSSASLRNRAITGALLLLVVALVATTPLLRYSIDHLLVANQRILTRLGEAERAYPGPVGFILLSNMLKGLGLFNYSGGSQWVVGTVRSPAFDLFTATLLLLGVCFTAMRYARQRQWQDLFLLLSLPLLLLPSTLSLAFPEENPAMNRASGAWVPAFVLAALALETCLRSLGQRLAPKRAAASQLAAAGLLALVAASNLGLFNQYTRAYRANSWNSAEMGAVIADFAASFGSLESAWVVAYPHWVDTRLVAMEANNPGRDYAIWPEQLAQTASVAAPRLYILKPEDTLALSTLQQLFPQGVLTTYTSQVASRDFYLYLVANN
ncbi:MAG: glycosyltransferase family 39 protein [Anaerolineales bacterium]|nr:glycosyltransferase family 39 protein [Anaerolineales bacterium]